MIQIIRKMPPRDVHEPHRVSTPLELLFDLVTVIAIASAAAGLHHAVSENHIPAGIIRYAMAFFGIWWAWMNYTWFASAYDNGDTPYRFLTMLIMAGALIMAAGISVFDENLNVSMMVIGYVVMRLGLVALWLRASRHDPEHRSTTLKFAGGVSLVQMYWVGLLFIPQVSVNAFYGLFVIGMVLELLVPVFAERKNNTPWHRHHIIERYGLLTIIVLGETLLSVTHAIEQAAHGEFNIALIHIALSALAILFSMWWLYFAEEEHLKTRNLAHALAWGYGHISIFLSGAAVGAGFGVLIDIVTGHSEVKLLVGDYAVSIPVALYFLGLWFVRDRHALAGAASLVLPVFAVLVLLVPLVLALEGIALVTVLSVMARSLLIRRSAHGSATSAA